MEYLVAQEIPVVSPHSGISAWSNPLKRTYFALQPSYQVEGRILAQFTREEFQGARIAIFSVEDQFGREGTAAFTSELSKSGIEPLTTIWHRVGESDPDRWVAELSASQPELVLLYTYVKPAADLLRTANTRDFYPAWLGSYVISGPDLLQLAGREASKGLRTATYPAGPRAHRGDRLYRNLMARIYPGVIPGTHSRIGYAAAQLVVAGLKRAGPDLTRGKFIQALESLQDWTGGLLPPITYSPTDHRGLTTLAIQRAISGRWVVEKGHINLQEK
jgi:branched-chain amino acid transport system substrate-binding protein